MSSFPKYIRRTRQYKPIPGKVDGRGGVAITKTDIHLPTHSGSPPKRSVWPALHAGEPGDRLRGIFSNEIMTLAQ